MEGYGLRVLVAEDDESTRYLISDVLSKAGYNVFPAVDGMVAIEELKKRHYDAVLTDYQMPRLNGLELLALSQELMPEIPVILISCAHLSLEQVAIERGAFAWIRKPVPVTQVLLIVRAARHRLDPAIEMGEPIPVLPRSRPFNWPHRLAWPDERGDGAMPATEEER